METNWRHRRWSIIFSPRLIFLYAALCILCSKDVTAHSTAKGNCQFIVDDSSAVQIQIDLTEEDILDLFDIDLSSKGEEPLFTPRMQSSIARWLRMTGDGEACPVQFVDWERFGVRSIRLEGKAQCPLEMETLNLQFGLSALSSLKLICLTSLMAPGGIQHTTILNRKHNRAEMVVRHPSILETVWVFFVSGAEHILLGWDHLAFLLGLLLMSATWTRLLWVVSGFTAAHSVTLVLGTLSIVVLPSVWVESLIALSIALTGVAGLWAMRQESWGSAKEVQGSVGAMIGLCFGFGLLHGLGFARMLQESIAASGTLFWPLLSFNLGVEAGQLFAVCLVYPLLRYLRKTPAAPLIWKILYAALALLGFGVTLSRIVAG
jgi:hypothetical protein